MESVSHIYFETIGFPVVFRFFCNSKIIYESISAAHKLCSYPRTLPYNLVCRFTRTLPGPVKTLHIPTIEVIIVFNMNNNNPTFTESVRHLRVARRILNDNFGNDYNSIITAANDSRKKILFFYRLR